jgi:hypothetical protein
LCRLAIFGAMSSVNNTAYVDDDNTTLNPTLHLDNLDLSLSTNLSYTNKSATFSGVWLNIINLCYDGFYRWFY